jgi:hypothetical protein
VPVLMVNVPVDVPAAVVGFKAVGVQPTGMLLPSNDIVGEVGSPLHSMIELRTFGVTPEADQVTTWPATRLVVADTVKEGAAEAGSAKAASSPVAETASATYTASRFRRFSCRRSSFRSWSLRRRKFKVCPPPDHRTDTKARGDDDAPRQGDVTSSLRPSGAFPPRARPFPWAELTLRSSWTMLAGIGKYPRGIQGEEINPTTSWGPPTSACPECSGVLRTM